MANTNFYVVDSTRPNQQDQKFPSYFDIVRYLEGMVQRRFGKTRKQYMDELVSIGHGYDDSDSVNFVRQMADHFNIGVLRDGVRKDEKMRCDITSMALFQREEYGS